MTALGPCVRTHPMHGSECAACARPADSMRIHPGGVVLVHLDHERQLRWTCVLPDTQLLRETT